MTNVTALPLPEQAAENEDQEQLEPEQQHAMNVLLAEAGWRGAGWVRELAGRQAEHGHRVVPARAADAVERACGRRRSRATGC